MKIMKNCDLFSLKLFSPWI